MKRPPPRSSLFPYTTLFRSDRLGDAADAGLRARHHAPHWLPDVPHAHAPVHVPAVRGPRLQGQPGLGGLRDRKSTRLNSSHANISYAVFCLKKKTKSVHIPI